MVRTGRPHDGEGGNERASAGGAGAVGKRTLVQMEAARGGAEIAPGGDSKPSEADRVADLVNRGAATDPRGQGPRVFPAAASAPVKERHDAACARLQLIEDSVAAEDIGRGKVSKDDKVEGKHSVEAQLAAT